MHKVDVDLAKNRVVVEFEAKLGDHAAWERILFSACRQAKGNGNHFDMLCDFTKMELMGGQDADNSGETVKWLTENGLRRAANIVGSALMKLQLNRLTDTNKIRSFATVSEGEAWLAE